MPSPDQKGTGERLSQKNGDVHHSTEKIPNGTDAAPSESNKQVENLFISLDPHLLQQSCNYSSWGPPKKKFLTSTKDMKQNSIQKCKKKQNKNKGQTQSVWLSS